MVKMNWIHFLFTLPFQHSINVHSKSDVVSCHLLLTVQMIDENGLFVDFLLPSFYDKVPKDRKVTHFVVSNFVDPFLIHSSRGKEVHYHVDHVFDFIGIEEWVISHSFKIFPRSRTASFFYEPLLVLWYLSVSPFSYILYCHFLLFVIIFQSMQFTHHSQEKWRWEAGKMLLRVRCSGRLRDAHPSSSSLRNIFLPFSLSVKHLPLSSIIIVSITSWKLAVDKRDPREDDEDLVEKRCLSSSLSLS